MYSYAEGGKQATKDALDVRAYVKKHDIGPGLRHIDVLQLARACRRDAEHKVLEGRYANT